MSDNTWCPLPYWLDPNLPFLLLLVEKRIEIDAMHWVSPGRIADDMVRLIFADVSAFSMRSYHFLTAEDIPPGDGQMLLERGSSAMLDELSEREMSAKHWVLTVADFRYDICASVWTIDLLKGRELSEAKRRLREMRGIYWEE